MPFIDRQSAPHAGHVSCGHGWPLPTMSAGFPTGRSYLWSAAGFIAFAT